MALLRYSGQCALGVLCLLIAMGAMAPDGSDVERSNIVELAPSHDGATSTSVGATTVVGRVRLADGTPVPNAVIVTQLGGKGVSQSDGSFAFDVDVSERQTELHVTAVASIRGVNYAGSVVAPSADPDGTTDRETNAKVITMAAGAQCEPSWLPTFGGELGVGPYIAGLTTFDDGSGGGSKLYVGGQFTTAGGTSANRIANWNGTASSTLGSGMNDTVRSFATVDNGSGAGPAIYAGGGFSVSPAGDSYLARWQGCPLGIPADLNADGFVSAADLGILLGGWNTSGITDINGDGTTNSVDLGILLGAWTG